MSDAQDPEASATARGTMGRGGTIALWTLIAILTLMFILPGFVSGIYSRVTGQLPNLFNEGYLQFNGHPVLNAFLYPSYRLSGAILPVGYFYVWEFNCVAILP